MQQERKNERKGKEEDGQKTGNQKDDREMRNENSSTHVFIFRLSRVQIYTE